jgi:hypothetical protein
MVLSQHLPWGTEEHHEKFVRIIVVLAKVQNEHLPETIQKHYGQINFFGATLPFKLLPLLTNYLFPYHRPGKYDILKKVGVM